MIIIIPIGLIVRLITCCIDACYEKAAERRARREAERLIAEQEPTHTTVTVVHGAPAATPSTVPPTAPPPPYSAASESSPLLNKWLLPRYMSTSILNIKPYIQFSSASCVSLWAILHVCVVDTMPWTVSFSLYLLSLIKVLFHRVWLKLVCFLLL